MADQNRSRPPGFLKQIFDGLANVMTGSGTTVDRRVHSQWYLSGMDAYQIEAAYRTSWLMRRIVDTPADDMTRAWRDWKAKDTQIEDLEALEKKLRLREKVKAAIRLGRLGGGAIILGLKDGTPDQPLPATIQKDDLIYAVAVSRYKLDLGPTVEDPEDPDFGEPASFMLKRKEGEPLEIHRDRVVVFKGEFSGSGLGSSASDRMDYWGESVVTHCDEPVKNAHTAMNEFASLIAEAKIDVFGIPDLLNNVGTAEYEQRLTRRLELAQQGKSNHRALIKDAAETWEQRQISWVGMPDVIRNYLAICAAASDIPATRLLSKSADGMNATGEGDQNNYDQMIRSRQDDDLRPQMEKIDRVLVPSALGPGDYEDIYFEFAPLSVPTEAQEAETENKEADTLDKLVKTGLFQDEALEEAYSNRMIESSRWPGYEAARKKALAAAAREPDPDDVNGLEVTQPPGTPPPQGPGNRGPAPAPARPQPSPARSG